jgi:hypothetical protein
LRLYFQAEMGRIRSEPEETVKQRIRLDKGWQLSAPRNEG